MVNQIAVSVTNIAPYTPQEAIELVARAGVKKGTTRPHMVFLSAVSAGCLLSFGAAASLIASTAPWLDENAPGLGRILTGAVFPVGFILVVLTGCDLFTASNMFTTVATLERRLPAWKMLLHWLICYLGNLAGSLFMMAIIFGYGGVFDASPFKEHAIAFAIKKQLKPEVHQIFLRAIGCNWLVCMAIYMATQAKDFKSKVVGMWWPIFAFVSLGLDHVIANMFFIPLGIWLHTPGLNVGLYIWKGMIPATLGNILGGGVFCGGYYWFTYLFGQDPVKVDGMDWHEFSHKASAQTAKRPIREDSIV